MLALMYESAIGVKTLAVDAVLVGVLVKIGVTVGVAVGSAPLNSNATVAVVVACRTLK